MPFDSDKITMAQIARNGGTLETREPRGRGRSPSFAQVVITPAVFVGLMFCGVSFSASLAAVSMYPDWLILGSVSEVGLFVVAFALGAGCLATLAVAMWQLGNWNNERHTVKRVTLNSKPEREPQRARVISRKSPTSWDVSRHAWEGELSKMARLFYNQRGEWVAPDRLTRNQLTGVVKSLTESYPNMRRDLIAWGWLDDNGDWTELGKTGLRAEYRPAPTRRPV